MYYKKTFSKGREIGTNIRQVWWCFISGTINYRKNWIIKDIRYLYLNVIRISVNSENIIDNFMWFYKSLQILSTYIENFELLIV